jgi:hypothetical protein
MRRGPPNRSVGEQRAGDDVSAAGIPVAYLTAQMALALAGFSGRQNRAGAGDRRIGRQRGKLARALGANTHFEHDQSCEGRAGEGARIQ